VVPDHQPPGGAAAVRSEDGDPARAALGPWLWLAAVVLLALATAVGLLYAAEAPELLAVLGRVGRGAVARRLLHLGQVVIATLALLVAAAAAATRIRRGAAALRAASTAFLLRLSAYLAFAVMAAMLVLDPAGRFDERPELAAAFGAAAWLGTVLLLAVLLLAWPDLLAAPSRRWSRTLDLAAFNALVVVLALEAALGILPHLSRSPLLQFDPILGAADERHVDETLRRFRLRPHVQLLDGAANSRGYLDDEMFVAEPDDFVAAVIADSFGVGVVSPRFNFVAELERRLQRALASRYRRVAAHNFGVTGAGFPEYRRVLLTEALPTRPSVVVLCIFVGNDLTRELRPLGAASFAVLRHWRTYQLGRRLCRIAIERWLPRATGVAAPAPPGSVPPSGTIVDEDQVPLRPRSLFLDIERARLEVCNTASPGTELGYRDSRVALVRFREAAGERLLVVLIPDEFQVNDALWAELVARTETPIAYDQTYPQQRLLAACRELGIEALDLLPLLAEAQRSGLTYKPNNTHWSRLGNAVAGAAIADAILQRPSLQTPGP
jgi:hypothetical protein